MQILIASPVRLALPGMRPSIFVCMTGPRVVGGGRVVMVCRNDVKLGDGGRETQVAGPHAPGSVQCAESDWASNSREANQQPQQQQQQYE